MPRFEGGICARRLALRSHERGSPVPHMACRSRSSPAHPSVSLPPAHARAKCSTAPVLSPLASSARASSRQVLSLSIAHSRLKSARSPVRSPALCSTLAACWQPPELPSAHDRRSDSSRSSGSFEISPRRRHDSASPSLQPRRPSFSRVATSFSEYIRPPHALAYPRSHALSWSLCLSESARWPPTLRATTNDRSTQLFAMPLSQSCSSVSCRRCQVWFAMSPFTPPRVRNNSASKHALASPRSQRASAMSNAR